MNQALELPLSVSLEEGDDWQLYSYSWKSLEGNMYVGYFYATSFYHATLLLEDLKSTAILDGEIVDG